jgi:hypothetical protein
MNHQQLVDEARATLDALRQRMAETYLADPMKGSPAYRRAQWTYYKAERRFYRRLRLRDARPAAGGSEAWQDEQAGYWLAANEATGPADDEGGE